MNVRAGTSGRVLAASIALAITIVVVAGSTMVVVPADAQTVPETSRTAQTIIDTWVGEQGYGRAAVTLAEPGEGAIASHDQSAQYVTASVAKLFVAYVILSRVDDGIVALGGYAGYCGTVSQCLETMILWSDNDAADTLTDVIGWASLDQTLHADGFPLTTLNNAEGGHRLTTAAEVADLLDRIATGSALSPASTTRLLDLMSRQNYRDGIPAGAPDSLVADKPGWLFDPYPSVTNDAALVFAPGATYILVVLTDRAFNWAAIAELSRRLHALYLTDDSDADVSTAARPAQWGKVVALPPTRILDTRQNGQPPALGRDSAMTLTVAGAGGVPTDVTHVAAVIANITAVGGRVGYVTAWGSGTMPLASALNIDGPGQTVANLAIVPVGSDGKIRLYSSSGTHLIVDVQGYIEPSTATSAGRIVAEPARRVLDTRLSGQPAVAGQDVVVALGPAPAPASAAFVHITLVNPSGAGHASLSPGRSGTDAVSNVNVAVGETRANEAIVPVVDGAITVRTNVRVDVIVDLEGWVTAAGAPTTNAGLVQAISPARLRDTRLDGQPVPARTPTTFAAVVPDGVGSVVTDLVATGSRDAGYVTMKGACDPGPQLTSNLNIDATDQTRAALAVVELVGTTHQYCVFSQATSDVVVDVEAYVHK